MKIRSMNFFVTMLLTCALFENINASLDTTFNPSGTPPGTVITPILAQPPTGPASEIYGVAIQNDQKIVAAGALETNSVKFALARYNTDGSLDTLFGTDGIVTTPFTNRIVARAQAVSIDNSGKIVAAGFAFHAGTYYIAVARYKIDGSLDATFGGNNGDLAGTVTTLIGSSTTNFAYALIIQGDNIIVGGFTNIAGTNNFALARYLGTGQSAGTLDTSFGGSSTGWVTTPVDSNGSIVRSLVLQGNKIVAVGSAADSSNTYFGLARYTADGVLDDSFGDNGIVTTSGFSGTGAHGAAVQSNGGIVVVGDYNNQISTFDFGVLARYTPDGTLDPTFGNPATPGIYFATSLDDMGYKALVLDAQQNIITAGNTAITAGNYVGNFVVTGFTPNGTPNGFNVVTSLEQGSAAYALAIQANGKIVLAGLAQPNQNNIVHYFALARYVPPIITGRLSALTIAIQNKYG